MGKVMNKASKIRMLKARFKKLNPGVGADMIDWKSYVGERETFSEALQDVRHSYPEYRWTKPKPLDDYQKVVLRGMRKDAEGYGFTVVRESERRRLSRGAKHIGHHNPKAKDEVAKVRVFIKEHNRKWPKKKPAAKKKTPTRSRRRTGTKRRIRR